MHTKPFLILLLILLPGIQAFNQEDLNQNAFINEKISIANEILYNYNKNIDNLHVFQDELNVWISKKNNESSFPILKFNAKEELDIYYRTRRDHGLLMVNYEFQLFKLNKYSNELNETCKELKDLAFVNSLQYNVEVAYFLRKIEKKAKFIAEISNDLSRTSALNYKDEAFPSALLNLQEVILYSKNLILAIRYNDKSLITDFKKLLDRALIEAEKNTTANSLKKESDVSMTNESIQSSLNSIYAKAQNISTWGAQYLQLEGDYEDNENEINQILELSIAEFNKTEDLFGCAYLYNKILEKTPKKYMFYTEEPKTLYIERIKIPKYKKTVEADQLKEQEGPEDINSLEGSLPNNLIILMDVSISMKKSGKFPLLIQSIKHTVNIMRPEDKISLIAYSGQTQVLITAATYKDNAKINEILNTLQSSGGSDLKNALEKAYEISDSNFISNGNNKLIIASDGVFGVTSTISDLVKEKTVKDLSLSVFHYGSKKDEVNTKPLRGLATTGNGEYELIETEEEAINAIMRQIKIEKDYIQRFD